jgi:hypothetical protein
VKLLGERLTPAAPADAKVLEKLIAALDSADFKVRQQATAELERLAELALPTLRKLLEGNPNLEVRRRVEAVVKNVTGPITVAERLRIVRAVAVLEQVGSLAAKQVLQRLAAGAPEALITQEAKASLARLAVGEYKTP